MRFALSPRADLDELASCFAKDGFVSIEPFLSDSTARALAMDLSQRSDWVEVLRGERETFDMPVAAFEALEPEQRRRLEDLVWQRAATEFQFRFRSVRVPDVRRERKPHEDVVHGFAEFMCSDASLELMRRLTGIPEISFADAQATAYSAGHFLTSHDDEVAGKGRVAAYVLSLTDDWSADWGGHLVFPGQGTISGFMPGFNCLRIFAVPRPHSVTFVPPFVTATRYSVTGWLRTGEPDN